VHMFTQEATVVLIVCTALLIGGGYKYSVRDNKSGSHTKGSITEKH
jgi:hypothetical protein